MPVVPGQTVPMVLSIQNIGNIYGQAGTPGHAFWGWFTDETLDVENRRNTASGLRRPGVSNVCELTTTLLAIENANNPQAVIDLFGCDSGGNITLYSIWALWGDVDDDDAVCQMDVNLLQIYIALDGMGGSSFPINRRAANVVVDELVCQHDLNLLRMHVAMDGIFDINPIVLGVYPSQQS